MFFVFFAFEWEGRCLEISLTFWSPEVHSAVCFIQHIVGGHWEHCWVSDCHTLGSQVTLSYSFTKLQRMGITVAKEELQEMVAYSFDPILDINLKPAFLFSCLPLGICWTISLEDWVQAGLGKERIKTSSCKLLPGSCWGISHAWHPFSAGLALEQVCFQDSADHRCEWHGQTSVRYVKYRLQQHGQVCQKLICHWTLGGWTLPAGMEWGEHRGRAQPCADAWGGY